MASQPWAPDSPNSVPISSSETESSSSSESDVWLSIPEAVQKIKEAEERATVLAAARKAKENMSDPEGITAGISGLNVGQPGGPATGAGTTTPSPGPGAAAAAAGDVKNEVKKPKKRKVLLMGKSGSGKSSMRSIIFSNYLAKDTRRLGATIDIDLSHVKFLGNLTLNLWDCGGQEAFMENYLSQQRQHVFSNVGVLIYVFDIEGRPDVERDLATYVNVLSALVQYSPNAKVFVLVHKMDLVMTGLRESVFEERCRLTRQKTAEYVAGIGGIATASGELDLTFYATSIWDQSLYRAWSAIIHDLVPNLAIIEQNLAYLGQVIEAEELILFERTSFLAISSWTSPEGARNPNEDRLERLSNIFKTFKQSIARFTGTPRNAEQFVVFELKQALLFSLYVTKFTTNTYLLVCLPPGEARFNSATLNIKIAIERFKFLDGPAAGAKDAAAAAAAAAAASASVSASGSGQQGEI